LTGEHIPENFNYQPFFPAGILPEFLITSHFLWTPSWELISSDFGCIRGTQLTNVMNDSIQTSFFNILLKIFFELPATYSIEIFSRKF